ncbi:hypothetical protein M011DRAFT_262973 [Sporormia fimetaria CBS 119925]|uniref:Uncharacterized protein n=1 Tax=Sporormia fimetaria CBS 119925 TaxID=1340428 RepID=A0A6A6UWG2_9PLEO|nr:hypothetical protein M011DRAFT_262973 [Sporormia fimetaria CBS 119925]
MRASSPSRSRRDGMEELGTWTVSTRTLAGQAWPLRRAHLHLLISVAGGRWECCAGFCSTTRSTRGGGAKAPSQRGDVSGLSTLSQLHNSYAAGRLEATVMVLGILWRIAARETRWKFWKLWSRKGLCQAAALHCLSTKGNPGYAALRFHL